MTIKFEFTVSENELQQIINCNTAETNATAAETSEEYEGTFNEAVKLLTSLDGKTFFELVEGAKTDNKFHVSDDGDLAILNKISRADDCWGIAIDKLTSVVGNDDYEKFMYSQIVESEHISDRIAAWNAAKAVIGKLL